MKLLPLLAAVYLILGFAHVHEIDPEPGHSHQGTAFDEGPRQFAKIIPGAGENINFQADECSAAARPFINQAMGQLHGFLNFEAERSFRHASYLDQTCALAYWGMAMANTLWAANPERAAAFIAEARKRVVSQTSERTQLYIQSVETLLQSPNGPVDYLQILREIFQKYPDDLDAKALFVVEVWHRKLQGPLGFEGDGYRDTNLAIDALAREVLAVNPRHPVHHYIIHLWDNPNDFALALSSADVSGFAAPSVAHLWHMSGHTYSQAKLYFDKWWSQEAAARVDHHYMQDMRVFPFMLHNHAHNNEWLSQTLMEIGDFGKALKLSFNMLAQPKHPTFNTLNTYGHLQNGVDRSLDILERGDYWPLAAKLIASPILSCQQFEANASSYQNCIRVGKLAEIFTGQALNLSENLELELDNEVQNVAQLMNGDRTAFRRLKRIPHLQSGWGLYSLVKYGLKAELFEETAELADQLSKEDPRNSAYLLLASTVLAKSGQTDASRKIFNKLIPISQNLDMESPIAQTCNHSLRAVFHELPEDWRQPFQQWRDAHTSRPNLENLGPLLWQPFKMENFRWVDKTGAWHELRQSRGSKASVVVFLLNDCPQCDAQYKKLETFQSQMDALGVSLVAVTAQTENFAAFASVGAFDNFESLPIHGLFVVNNNDEIVWQDLSATAFMDIDFLLDDLKRLVHPLHRSVLLGDIEELMKRVGNDKN